MSRAKCIMVQGTMSGAGKSLLCAALCRVFAQDGYRVAPFKSQNMALNSFVTRDGLEMGRAQVVQAQAAGIEPDVRMNPILLKPSSDVGSQVIVNGEVRGQMKAVDYFRHKKQLIPDVLAAYNSLAEDVDIIVIEGAGSPAEINLKADDIVNMGLAKLVDAPVLLAGDIDRGGVFAQLYGTVELLEPEEPGGDWRLRVRCSKGTYVRTLCHDIGRALGCGGCMSSLRRTMAAGFTLAECRTIEEVQQQGESLLAATDSLFRQYPAYRIPSEQADRRCRCGNPLTAEGLRPGLYRVYGTDGTFLCLSRWENGVLTSEKNFFGA